MFFLTFATCFPVIMSRDALSCFVMSADVTAVVILAYFNLTNTHFPNPNHLVLLPKPKPFVRMLILSWKCRNMHEKSVQIIVWDCVDQRHYSRHITKLQDEGTGSTTHFQVFGLSIAGANEPKVVYSWFLKWRATVDRDVEKIEICNSELCHIIPQGETISCKDRLGSSKQI